MRLSNIKKGMLAVGLTFGLVSGSIVAFAEPSQIIIPGKTLVTPNTNKATRSNSTPSIATRSNTSSRSRSSSSSGSSNRGGAAKPVTTAPGANNIAPNGSNIAPNGSSNNSNTTNMNTTRNVGPTGPNGSGSTKGDATGAKRGKLNVPKTADASAMGLYAALLGLSAAGGAYVVATKKKED